MSVARYVEVWYAKATQRRRDHIMSTIRAALAARSARRAAKGARWASLAAGNEQNQR